MSGADYLRKHESDGLASNFVPINCVRHLQGRSPRHALSHVPAMCKLGKLLRQASMSLIMLLFKAMRSEQSDEAVSLV